MTSHESRKQMDKNVYSVVLCVQEKLIIIDRIIRSELSEVIYSIAETAKANNLKPYEYFEYLLEEIPEHMEDIDRSFLERLLPWSPELPEKIRKPK